MRTVQVIIPNQPRNTDACRVSGLCQNVIRLVHSFKELWRENLCLAREGIGHCVRGHLGLVAGFEGVEKDHCGNKRP